jgi:hypothetical protein
MLELNIYKNQKEVEKTYRTEAYDLMYGTVEDVLSILDGITDKTDNMQIFNAVSKNREKINMLLLDVFPDATPDELRKVKLKELVPFFIELFSYVGKSFSNSKN